MHSSLSLIKAKTELKLSWTISYPSPWIQDWRWSTTRRNIVALLPTNETESFLWHDNQSWFNVTEQVLRRQRCPKNPRQHFVGIKWMVLDCAYVFSSWFTSQLDRKNVTWCKRKPCSCEMKSMNSWCVLGLRGGPGRQKDILHSKFNRNYVPNICPFTPYTYSRSISHFWIGICKNPIFSLTNKRLNTL